ncbi:suppressor APC domain-containing protein 1 [Genypterus blacodes]|uniref:suppressor APC domain-containing protein 1 n=1 Tax=Genypterus blacodes TaxID=154954 RepID=UPI003F75C517
MACRSPASYTVVIIPFRTSLYSVDALRFYLWIKHMKDLEMEKDALWCGLDVLEKARLWYLHRLVENRTRHASVEAKNVPDRQDGTSESLSCLLRSCIQRVNGSLGTVMSDPTVTSSSNHSLLDAVEDSDLRWHNAVLTQEVTDKNRRISMLELEKDALLHKLDELQAC